MEGTFHWRQTETCLEAKKKVAAKTDSSSQHPHFESGTFGNCDSIFLTACPHVKALKLFFSCIDTIQLRICTSCGATRWNRNLVLSKLNLEDGISHFVFNRKSAMRPSSLISIQKPQKAKQGLEQQHFGKNAGFWAPGNSSCTVCLQKHFGFQNHTFRVCFEYSTWLMN